jgi:DeoR/GlpR family transcriptional regulator of sugar metabolism
MTFNVAALFINIGTTTETITRALLNHKALNIVKNKIHADNILLTK